MSVSCVWCDQVAPASTLRQDQAYALRRKMPGDETKRQRRATLAFKFSYLVSYRMLMQISASCIA